MKGSIKNVIQKVVQNSKFEPLLFLFFIFLNLLPIFSGKFFPTLDGPAHLYNSQLIIDLVFNTAPDLKNYFELNPDLVPNWTGHFILAWFNYFFPAFIAEKILLAAYVIVLPYAFRKLTLKLNPDGVLISYLIFPFVYSFMFILGFYNFSIAIIFLFLVLAYWIKTDESKRGTTQIVFLGLLLLCLYFSHLVVFGISLIAIGLHILFNFYISELPFQIKLVKGLNKIGTIVLAAIVPLSLSIYFFITRDATSDAQFLSKSELIQGLIHMDFLDPSESTYYFLFFLLFCLLSIFIIFKRIRFYLEESQRGLFNIFRKQDYWMILVFLMLVLYFVMPDMQGGAGYISLRMNHLLFIFWMLWIVSNKTPKILSYLTIVFILYSSLVINNSFSKKAKKMSEQAVLIQKAANYIPTGSIVLPLNFTDHWMMGHFSNYLGLDKSLIVLDNYESTVDYFPVKFNQQLFPNFQIEGFNPSNTNCISWLTNPYAENIVYAPYILIYGRTVKTGCNEEVFQNIKKSYDLIYKNDLIELYSINILM